MPELHISVHFGNITFRCGNLFHVFAATRLQKLKPANQSHCTAHTEEAHAVVSFPGQDFSVPEVTVACFTESKKGVKHFFLL